MSKITLTPNAAGTGTFTVASPNSNTNRTLTLPDSAGELLTKTGDGSALTGISPFKPVAVTGTTPSLDLGAYNYFRQTLTADTTLTFASVPTDARWSYTFNAVLANPYDLTAATTEILNSFSVNAQDYLPSGLFFKPDGTKMYMVGDANNNVNEYDLSTAWDISTAAYLQLFSVAGKETFPYEVFFSPDGVYMYVCGESSKSVHQYTLSTAWDISSAVFTRSLSVTAYETVPQGLYFTDDGLKMYIAGSNGDEVNQWTLSTAWDISTATWLQLFSVASQETAPSSLTFSSDGLSMFVIGTTSDNVNEYALSTAWDISTASFTVLFAFGSETLPRGMFFKSDGASIFIVGEGSDTVREYLTSGVATLTLPASVQNPPTSAILSSNTVTYEFSTLDGGTNVYLINEEVL